MIASSALGAPVELATKQAVENLRYVSHDGKVTYYQNTSGTFYYSTNYKVTSVLKSTPGTQYNVILTNAKKRILIEQNPHQFNFLSLRAPKNIYISDYKGTKATEVGKGLTPRLHLNDEWLSFYNAHKKEILFQGIKNKIQRFSIQLRNKVNPYFIPDVVMINENIILFTDINNKGLRGLIEFNRKTKKLSPLVKASSPLEKIELCLGPEYLFIGIFGQSKSKVGSSISSYKYKSESIDKRDLIYESQGNDLGNIICSNKKQIYFIKRRNDYTYDAARFNLQTKKVDFISDTGAITQISNMDGKIISESMGKYFILDGENNLGDDIWVEDEKK